MSERSEFPDSLFDVADGARGRYREQVHAGYRVMRERSVVVCGLARNIAGILPATMARIECLGQMFADYRVVIYENDSEDNTREQLNHWSKNNARVHIVCEQRGDPINRPIRCLERAARMAHYRNQCRLYVKSNFPTFDHVIVVDTDLEEGWSYEGVANTFGHRTWDFVGSNGLIHKTKWGRVTCLHYDAWAFRPMGSYERVPTRVVNRMQWRKGESMLPVHSCFGGLGIYRMQAMLACQYDGSDCEHVTIHRSMRETGFDRLFLNPSQITYYGRRSSKLHRAYSRFTQSLRPAA